MIGSPGLNLSESDASTEPAKSDTGNHRIAADDIAFTGQGHAVLVIQGRVVDLHQHVSIGQVVVLQVLDFRSDMAIRLA